MIIEIRVANVTRLPCNNAWLQPSEIVTFALAADNGNKFLEVQMCVLTVHSSKTHCGILKCDAHTARPSAPDKIPDNEYLLSSFRRKGNAH